MSSKNRLSREEKGNVIEVSSNPHKDVTVNGSPLDYLTWSTVMRCEIL